MQHWGSWFGDWGKGLLLGCVFASILGWILYGVLRRSPRRWWFYFWLALIPIVIFVMFIEPVWIEPMFNKFEPLTDHHADLVAQIERVVHRAGMDIPPRPHVRDEGQREDHDAERLRHRLRRDQARGGVGHHDAAHDHAGNALRLRARDGALRTRTIFPKEIAIDLADAAGAVLCRIPAGELAGRALWGSAGAFAISTTGRRCRCWC